jgi:hypothetical protein
MRYHKKFDTIKYSSNCYKSVEIELATNDTSSHLNISLRSEEMKRYQEACICPTDAMRLRDMLIEAYPISSAPPPPEKKPSYVLDYYPNTTAVVRVTYELAPTRYVEKRNTIAIVQSSSDDARSICDALNAAAVK